MHAFLPARGGAAPASGDTGGPSPALSAAVPAPRARGQLRPTPAGRSAPLGGHHGPCNPPLRDPPRRGPPRRQREQRPGLPSREPARPTLRAPAPAPRPCAQPSRALHPPHRNRFPSLIPILTLSFQICLPPPPPPAGAKPPRLPGRAGGHAGLGGRCLPALRGSPEVLGSRSSPAAAALSVSGRGAGRAPSKPLLPNLRRCAGGGRRSRGSAAALNPFFLRRRPGAPLVAQAPPGTALAALLPVLLRRLSPQIPPPLLFLDAPLAPAWRFPAHPGPLRTGGAELAAARGSPSAAGEQGTSLSVLFFDQPRSH